MIQRVQSLFLLAAALCLIVMLFFPVWEKVDTSTQSSLVLRPTATISTTLEEGSSIYHFPAAIVGILAVTGALISLYSLFQYRNRLTQVKLGALNSLVMAAVLGLCVYLTFRLEQSMAGDTQGQYEIGMYLPAVALIFNLLANRFIRKDEALVRSVDRIR